MGLRLPVNGVNHYTTVDCRICPHNWWYREPSLIDSFLDAYDFTGKTVFPFFTSGGSQLGEGQGRIETLAKGATVLAGKRFSARASESELKAWVDTLCVK